MLSCWHTIPESRPLFNSLENKIGDMLDQRVRKRFIALNKPHLYANALKLSNGSTDYLSMIDDSLLPSPRSSPTYPTTSKGVENFEYGTFT